MPQRTPYETKMKKGMRMKTNQYPVLLGLISLVLASACNSTKYLAEDEKLYDKGNVIIHKDSIPAERKQAFEEQLQGLLTPKPNKKLLGVRFKLGFWNMGG